MSLEGREKTLKGEGGWVTESFLSIRSGFFEIQGQPIERKRGEASVVRRRKTQALKMFERITSLHFIIFYTSCPSFSLMQKSRVHLVSPALMKAPLGYALPMLDCSRFKSN